MRCLLFVLLAGWITAAGAAPIPLINASFEEPNIGGGSQLWSNISVTGWTDSAIVPFGATILHPNSGILPYAGDQMVTFQVDNRFGNKHIQQNTSATITADTSYTASVFLGAADTAKRTGTIELVAAESDVVLASFQAIVDEFNVTGVRWREYSVDYTATALDQYLGETLAIRMYRAQGYASAYFDSVSLDAVSTPVPAPSGIALVLIGLAGLASGRYNRQ